MVNFGNVKVIEVVLKNIKYANYVETKNIELKIIEKIILTVKIIEIFKRQTQNIQHFLEKLEIFLL